MIGFHSLNEFALANQDELRTWIIEIIKEENHTLGEINYVFCDDIDLLGLNKKYLDHDTLTDIISFDYTQGVVVSGDIYISTERVKENATVFSVEFDYELRRVMAHGVLHYCGYKDKTEEEKTTMRMKEDYYLSSGPN